MSELRVKAEALDIFGDPLNILIEQSLSDNQAGVAPKSDNMQSNISFQINMFILKWMKYSTDFKY